MSNRKDNKGRVLHRGEGQRPDGRYSFKYTNWMGKTCFVYSWTLTIHDKTPHGKKRDLCLRQKEQQIQKDLFDHIAPENMNVMTLVENYLATKVAVRKTTVSAYKTVTNYLKTDSFEECGIIRRNPFNFELINVLVNDTVSRESLSIRQERLFLEFMRSDHHFSRYFETYFILLNTGLRISEYCGLTLDDIDFENHFIYVQKQLHRARDMQYYVEEPKTKSGMRYIPMTASVEKAFHSLIGQRTQPKEEPVIDGVRGFICLDKNEMPCVALHWEHRLKRAIIKHNRIYKEELPHITPHQLRHTFCSRMARAGMSPAKLRYIMGHSDINTTYNVYTHLGLEDIQDEMLAIEQNRR